jgi:hypothetical protein
MLPVTISTKDPDTGAELQVPPEFAERVSRASEILGEELGELTKRFDLGVVWHFLPDSGGSLKAHLSFTQGRTLVGTGYVYTADSLKDDESTRRSLRPALVEFGRALSSVVKQQLEQLQKRIEQDLEALATVTGD